MRLPCVTRPVSRGAPLSAEILPASSLSGARGSRRPFRRTGHSSSNASRGSPVPQRQLDVAVDEADHGDLDLQRANCWNPLGDRSAPLGRRKGVVDELPME